MTKHMMDILDHTGHTSIGWDPENEEEIEIARAAFISAADRGYHAFRVIEDPKGGPGRRGERMTGFDPTAEKMILMPQLRGG